MQSVPITSKVVSLIQASWQGVFDITLCDKKNSMSISRPTILLTP